MRIMKGQERADLIDGHPVGSIYRPETEVRPTRDTGPTAAFKPESENLQDIDGFSWSSHVRCRRLLRPLNTPPPVVSPAFRRNV